MTFADQLKGWSGKVTTKYSAVSNGVGEECLRSIREGSEITGAPGQQVDEGGLIRSWQRTFPNANEQAISTNEPYALQEEDGISYAHGGGPIVQHSEVGGPHSLKLTVAGFPRIVEIVTQRVVGHG